MVDLELTWHLLFLLLVANGVPILARNLLDGYADWPVDGGRLAPDGRPVFGRTKTWRGLLLSVVVTASVAPVLGYSWSAGALFAGYSLLGDLLSSFVKRRAGMPLSARATGLDQVPEAGLPLLVMHGDFSVNLATATVTVVGFLLLEVVLSRLLFRLHIRRRPY